MAQRVVAITTSLGMNAPAFIEALRATGNVTRAAQYARRSRNQAYHVRRHSEDFAAQWDEALGEGIDLLEAEARRRAFTGIDKPVYYKGEVVGSITKYSDRLLMFLLRAHRPQKFPRRRQGRAARRH